MRRRDVIALLGGSMAAWPLRSQAEDYPARPITLIVPWPAGGAVDALGRSLVPVMSEHLGAAIVVDNRPGAGSVIGTAMGAKAAPDGYTLVMPGSGALAISARVRKSLPYDPKNDFAPIVRVAEIPFVLVVNAAVPVRSLEELVGFARQNPGKLSYGSGGPGSPHHLIAEMLCARTGITLAHVPYKGSAPAFTDVLGGHIQLMFSDPVPALPMINDNRVRALGVSTAARLPTAPHIPPLAEVGVPGFDVAGWTMMAAPGKTPEAVVSKLRDAARFALAKPEIRDQIVRLGMIPDPGPPPEQLAAFIDAEMTRWGAVVEQVGLAGTE